ncbi:MAG: response regulator [Geminicoccaceae bacterium]
MTEQLHIVVVDDEPEIRETIQDYLELHECRVTQADGGASLRAIIEQQKDAIDLVLLDIAMPGEDGLSLARFLREKTDIAIVMLTASGDVTDRIVGYEIGADDYIPKPVDLRELLARIKAVMRRGGQAAKASPGEAPLHDANVVDFGDCRLDLDAHRLFAADGEEITITSMEFELLKAFVERPKRVLSREQLLELAHSKHWGAFDRSIDIRIARLRRKVERDPSKPQVIKTVRGAGYVYEPAH